MGTCLNNVIINGNCIWNESLHELLLRYINQISFAHCSEQQFKQLLLISMKMLLYFETTASNPVEVLNLSGLQAMIASIAIHCDNQANLFVIIIIINKTWSALLKFDFPVSKTVLLTFPYRCARRSFFMLQSNFFQCH